MKLLDAKRDHYRKLAKEQGYRSRATYKLLQLNNSYRIIGPGFFVVDLGCAPGGWTQIAVKLAGNRGKVVGVDTAYMDPIDGAHFIRGSVEDETIVDDILEYLQTKASAVICDLSPQITGHWSMDHAKQISLNYSCSKIMDKILATKGNALFKVFDGEYSMEFRDYLKKKFAKVHLRKPNASRKPSSEMYFVCLGYGL
ncbi:RlmE family RNA methyltransferase [Candidatus Nitrosotenuis cloacae]|jgi:23S rRNA (uridine2552-2'-O)-methyltransferase|uniref:RlmE family RNA methyltransferase n=1 Tax=Candidatus Nitrosotenuis cloacae TaxID=1603555 RepID=UPI0022807923|nr:RlmE family RNA methyltransferase [Candidatus Nitrosotenuis cloacae]